MSTPRFLADEDFRYPLIQAMRRIEPSIELYKIHELGLAGMQDPDVLQYALDKDLIILSHDVSTLKGLAKERIDQGLNTPGLFFAPQSIPMRIFIEELRMIWFASEHEEWFNRINHIPLK